MWIDLTSEGKILKPLPGVYKGNLIVKKSIILDGGGEVVLDGKNRGTVIKIIADSVTIRNMKIINSGHSHNQVHSGVLIDASHTLIENTIIENVLFGIHIKNGEKNRILNNYIQSIQNDLTLKGEGIRLWNSRHNILEGNRLNDVRDIVFTNSPLNIFSNNFMSNSRIGIELIYSPSCMISNNTFVNNEHGIIGIYSDSLFIEKNEIKHQNKLRGSAIAVKGSSQILVEENTILDCAIGLTANAPIFPENIIILKENTFAYNDVAIYLYGDRGGHIINRNVFKGNFQDVVVTHPSAAVENDWCENYWDNYVGFDLDNNQSGDLPFEIYLYSEQLWMDREMARFFRGSPLLEMIDFMERLAPFLDPPLVLRDENPRMIHHTFPGKK